MIGSRFPSQSKIAMVEGYAIIRTCNGCGCITEKDCDIYSIGSRSIVDRMSQSEGSGCMLKGCDPLILRCDIKIHSFINKIKGFGAFYKRS